jgi:hypothetical protein
MLRLMAEMMKLPVVLFVSGMEVFVRAMREYQQMAGLALDRTVDKIGSDETRAGGREGEAIPPSVKGRWGGGVTSETNVRGPQKKESDAMIDDRALNSEDLKTVRYRIIFTKRNHETTLKEDEATVNYVTDQGSLGGRYIADFWAGAATGGEQKALRRLHTAGYREFIYAEGAQKGLRIPEGEIKEALKEEKPVPVKWTILDDDKKYITFKADLLDQLPRQKGEYDREKAEELRKIREILDNRL